MTKVLNAFVKSFWYGSKNIPTLLQLGDSNLFKAIEWMILLRQYIAIIANMIGKTIDPIFIAKFIDSILFYSKWPDSDDVTLNKNICSVILSP